MSESSQVGARAASVGREPFSRDVMLEVLSNRRRRFTMHYLKQQHGRGQVTVSDLAERVASWENDKPVEELSHQERKRVRNALRQFHLPKMADYGFIDYDSRRGTVALTEEASNANFYIDSLTGGDVPWGLYYLALSGLSLLCLGGLWFGVYPLTALSPLLYGVFFVTTLLVSSVGHLYDNYYRMRLGARERPPEVTER